jgi:hypothetical protein
VLRIPDPRVQLGEQEEVGLERGEAAGRNGGRHRKCSGGHGPDSKAEARQRRSNSYTCWMTRGVYRRSRFRAGYFRI